MMQVELRSWLVLLTCLMLVACGGAGDGTDQTNRSNQLPGDPAYPSIAWEQREITNYARVLEAPTEQVTNPQFMQRLLGQSATNLTTYTQRSLADPSWLLANLSLLNGLPAILQSNNAWLTGLAAQLRSDPQAALALSFNTPVTPLCAANLGPCAGDPFRYPGSDTFYTDEASVEPIVFYDQDCTRLSGHVWAPASATVDTKLPAVIIETGSIQAPETVHWWAAQALVWAGYVVMTFDVRGQGRSDFTGPRGELGTDADPSVFWKELVNAIDFLHSTPDVLYPHNQTCAGTYPTSVTAYNPHWRVTDPDRLGLAGHSTGGYSVAVVQAYGSEGAGPWPGLIDDENPVDAVVAWDGMVDPQGEFGAYGQLEFLQLPVYRDLFETLSATLAGDPPPVVPRVPAMMHFSDYGAAPIPYIEPPPPEAYERGLRAWQAAGVPAFALTIRGASHYEWSLLPLFPSTSWCPRVENGHCAGGWGLPMARYYTVAWFDRWLKEPGEAGYASADARLLDDGRFAERFSYHFKSGRAFPDREGHVQVCDSVRAGC